MAKISYNKRKLDAYYMYDTRIMILRTIIIGLLISNTKFIPVIIAIK